MKLKRTDCILYAVTDRTWLGKQTLAEQVEAALQGGVTMVQMREKNLEENRAEQEALELKMLCRKYGVPFIINNNVEMAKRIDADGVHVGQSDMEASQARIILGPDKIIGVTARTVEQARAAQEAGADYLGSGAVFGSFTKLDSHKLELEELDRICGSVTIPVVAIGGIQAGNIAELKGRKIAGAAVVSGIFAQNDIKKGTEELKKRVIEILGIGDE
ncbi:MAG: thiamine phosphate synthase [Lachnospiraceae bacterium]|nr:thiamine phosphate synthase [Lachnospiraceae bacterium]MDD3796201.1 thiamine phosphate synthase [Lachnospiraceae bacterium]